MRRCPQCGEENPDRFRLCGNCGQQLAPSVAATEVRKTVTIVFCDLKGSTNLGERLDSEALREVLGRYFEIMRAILERHGGTVEKYIGDAIMAVFGLPRLHEDDALRAVRAAAEMRSALTELNAELELRWGVHLANRTGVNTGEVVAGDATLAQRLVTGDAVNVAARLEQAAPERDVLIGDTTYRLVKEVVDVEPVEPLTLKGKSEPVPAYRLISVRAGDWFSRRLEAPLVGRTEELDLLLDAFQRATRGQRLEVVTVLGHAGLGKTRLIREFADRLGTDTRVLRGRCISYGEGMTFWPVAEILRQAGGITEADDGAAAQAKLLVLLGGAADVADRLAATVGFAEASFPLAETFWAVRKLIEILAAERPLVVIFDDIHWAEPTLLDLLEHVADTAGGAGALVICAARHDLFDEHAEWMQNRANASRVVLEGLNNDETAGVVANFFDRASIPVAVRDRVIVSADGNPLFVEQILSLMVDDGLLRRDDEGEWVASIDIASLHVPPTISALLAARLDRLPGEERVVLDTGSVAGVMFYEDAVRWLCPEPVRERVPVNLMVLMRKQLIRYSSSVPEEEHAFRFSHVLVREATYQRLLKRMRAQLHERFAEWLEHVTAARALEFEELVGYHLEQASLYLSELGPLDEHGKALALKAAERLAAAGANANTRGDMPAAASFLERAIALRGEGDPARLELAVDLAEALREMGEFEKAGSVVSLALSAADPSADERLYTALRLSQLLLERLTRPAGWIQVAQEQAERAIAIFERTQDHVGLARAWRLLGTIHGTSLRYASAQQAVQHAVEEARLARNRREETWSLPALALCALHGPEPVERAISRCERLVEEASGDRRAQALILAVLALLRAMRADFSRARENYRRARATLEDLGDRLQGAGTSLYAARVELLAENAAEAEARLRPDYESLRRMGERNFVPTAAAYLGDAAYLQGRLEEADALSRISEETASPGDVESQYRWRCVRATLLARTGRIEEAVELANAALKLVLPIDSPAQQAHVYSVLANVLSQAGDRDESERALDRAALLYAIKGDVVSAERVERMRSALLASRSA